MTHLRQFGGHDPRAVRLNAESPLHSDGPNVIAALAKRARRGCREVSWHHALHQQHICATFQSREQLEDLLARSILETVQWHDSIIYLHQEEKVKRWIGIGPGKVGRDLVGKEVGMEGAVKGGGVRGISDPREVEQVLKALEETERYEEHD